jgi:ribosomal protein L11 methyltransferase
VKWTTVRVSPTRGRDDIAALLISEGASCVQEDGEDLVTSFPEPSLPRDLEWRIHEIDTAARIDTSPAPEISYELHGTVTARKVGEIFVVPTWEAHAYPRESSVVIEPGGAFGTGDHETTRGVLDLLQGVIRAGDVVADLGAGSGVLSIAAAKLGASRVAAVEVDHDAIANAEENVVANSVSKIVTVLEGDATLMLPLLAPVDLVLANIVSGVLIGMLPLIRRSLAATGHAILSGILVSEREMMLKAFADVGWSIEREHREGEWWSVLIAPR